MANDFKTCTRHLSKVDCKVDCIYAMPGTTFMDDHLGKLPETKPKPTHVSAEHLAQLRQSVVETELAAAHMEIAQLKHTLAQAQKDIAMLRLDAGIAQAAENYADIMTQAQTAKEQHHVLAQQLAIHYGVDWKTTSFVPETGELIATPEDNTP